MAPGPRCVSRRRSPSRPSASGAPPRGSSPGTPPGASHASSALPCSMHPPLGHWSGTSTITTEAGGNSIGDRGASGTSDHTARTRSGASKVLWSCGSAACNTACFAESPNAAPPCSPSRTSAGSPYLRFANVMVRARPRSDAEQESDATSAEFPFSSVYSMSSGERSRSRWRQNRARRPPCGRSRRTRECRRRWIQVGRPRRTTSSPSSAAGPRDQCRHASHTSPQSNHPASGSQAPEDAEGRRR